MHIYRSGHTWENKEREGQPTVNRLGRLSITGNDRYIVVCIDLANFLLQYLRIRSLNLSRPPQILEGYRLQLSSVLWSNFMNVYYG
jgi:hypothetical protein